jgi:hypothetical protein
MVLTRISKIYESEGPDEGLGLCVCPAFSAYLQIFADSFAENEVFSGAVPAIRLIADIADGMGINTIGDIMNYARIDQSGINSRTRYVATDQRRRICGR